MAYNGWKQTRDEPAKRTQERHCSDDGQWSNHFFLGEAARLLTCASIANQPRCLNLDGHMAMAVELALPLRARTPTKG